jgi:hypothetical protein
VPDSARHLKDIRTIAERQVKDSAPSHPSVATTVTIDELKREVLAAVGKWALAIIGTIIVLTAAAQSQWNNMGNRVDRLETWRVDADVRFNKQDILNDKFADIARDVKWITEYMGKPKENNP